MTEYCCDKDGFLVKAGYGCCKGCGRIPTFEWSPAREKLAKVLTDAETMFTIEHARLWVVENVLKAGWAHDE